MRKILSFTLTILMLTLISCSETTTNLTEETTFSTEITTTTEAPLDSFTELGYEYEMLSYQDPNFDVEISNIVFDVLQRKISFHYEISDYTTARSYYFVYGYEGKTFRPFHPILTKDRASSGDYTLDMLYDEANPEAFMTIEMGYFPYGASIHKEYPETNSVGFCYRINSIESRGMIDDYQINFGRDDSDSYHNAGFRLLVDDPSQTVTSIKLVVIDVFMDGYVVEEQIISIDSSMRTENGFSLDSIIFTDLSPTVRYQVTVYMSGDDGMYSFENTKLGHKQTQMEIGYFITNAHHDFYCEIHSSLLIDGVINIDILLKNGGIYLINDELPEIYLNIYHSITDTEPYFSIKLDEGFSEFDFNISEAELYDVVKIEDKDRAIVLSKAALYSE